MRISNNNHKKFSLVSLFAGIGGFELAFEKIANTILMCEIDNVAQHVLNNRFSSIPLVGDIRDIKALPNNTDILCAGFPCQDLSSAGEKRGMLGTRSSLVKEVFRLLKNQKIEWVVIENVSFMLRLNKGETIETITSELHQLGYKWAYRTIDSISFVPQHRARVFIVASLTHDPRNVLLSDNYNQSIGTVNYDVFESPLGFYWTEGRNALGLVQNAIPTLKAGSTIGIPSPPAIAFPNGTVAMPNICDAEALQGFPRNWTLPAEEIRKKSARWKLIGNAVTVDTVSWIANKIGHPSLYDCSKDKIHVPGTNWPKAAWCIESDIYESESTFYPLRINYKLEDYIQETMTPLSLKATNGFVKRLQEGHLKHPQYFSDTLNDYITKLK